MDWGDEVFSVSSHSGVGGIDRILKDARRGDTEAVRQHLQRSPELLYAKSGGHNRTFLWEATRGNRVELVELLLDMGASPNVPGRIRAQIPVLLKPHCIARRYRHRPLAERLIEAGGFDDIYMLCYFGDSAAVGEALESSPEVLHQHQPEETVWKVTPLHFAVAGGHADLVRELIERGAEVAPYTRLLCDIACRSKRPDLIDILIDGGANLDLARAWGAERDGSGSR